MRDRELAEAIARRVKEKNGRAYYVGGCVRDAVMGREGKDLDIEVYGLYPEELEKLLQGFGAVKAVGKSFGIFTLAHAGLDIALPRTERKIGDTHHSFFTHADPFLPEEEACRRRDFTMNALLEDVLSGERKDYFGGLQDIREKKIALIDPLHFPEDPLRVLRAARFAAQLDFFVEEETRKVCSGIDLSTLSKERVFEESEKALLAPRPERYFEELQRMGQLSVWYPELEGMHYEEILRRALPLREKAEHPAAFLLAVLLSDLPLTARKTLLDRLSNEKEIRHQALTFPEYRRELQTQEEAFALFDSEKQHHDLALYLSLFVPGAWKEYHDAYEEFLKEDHISGSDLLTLGIPAGAGLGELLKKIRREEYTRSKEDILREWKEKGCIDWKNAD